MRIWVTPLFFALFGLWLASVSDMGLNLYGHLSHYGLYLIVMSVLSPSLLVPVCDRRLELRNAAIAIACVVAGQIIWRDYIHVSMDFKLYGSLMQETQPAIMALGVWAACLEWRSVLTKGPTQADV